MIRKILVPVGVIALVALWLWMMEATQGVAFRESQRTIDSLQTLVAKDRLAIDSLGMQVEAYKDTLFVVDSLIITSKSNLKELKRKYNEEVHDFSHCSSSDLSNILTSHYKD